MKNSKEMSSQDTTSTNNNVAAIFGVTGIVGKELARMLLTTHHWKVYGIARRPDDEEPSRDGYRFISCDLLDPLEARYKLSALVDVTHVFWVTWASDFPLDSTECCDTNKAMMRHALDVILLVARGLRHVSLQTGIKHYFPLTGVLSGNNVDPYNEESPRIYNECHFYYALEDLLHEMLPNYNVAWAVHRPALVMGCSRRTYYNFVGSICVYGTICKHMGLPFVFGGTKQCWEEMYIDASDACLVAEQHIWASTINDRGGQAFNAINGKPYTWKEIWGAIGSKLGVEVVPLENSQDFSYTSAMVDKEMVWKEIVNKEELVDTEMKDLANWQFLDILFRLPVKTLVTRNKADQMGFNTKYDVLNSMLYWIDVMRLEKYIP